MEEQKVLVEYMTARYRRMVEDYLQDDAPFEIVSYFDPKTLQFQIRPTQRNSETIDIKRLPAVQ